MVRVRAGVEDALAFCCCGEFFRCRFTAFACLVREGGVGEFARRLWGGLREGGDGLPLEGVIEDGDDVVDAAHAAAVAEFLGGGEAPWDFPLVVVS